MDEIFDIQNRPQMSAHFRAILMGYTVRLINEDTNNRLVLGAGYFGVNQLEAMVDCDSFSQFLNPCCNRFVSHCHPPKVSPQKKKWARNPPDKTPCLRASCELYGKDWDEATAPPL